jgi:hypothetical protein
MSNDPRSLPEPDTRPWRADPDLSPQCKQLLDALCDVGFLGIELGDAHPDDFPLQAAAAGIHELLARASGKRWNDLFMRAAIVARFGLTATLVGEVDVATAASKPSVN